jgi:hypothetical protein
MQRLARRAPVERCDLCSEPLADAHRHLLEADNRSVACVCPGCVGTSLRTYRLIPDRYLNLVDFAMTDMEWSSLRVPVGIRFITAGRAYYPGPMGPTESALDAATWSALCYRHPVLTDIQPDVEALLVNRARGARSAGATPLTA